MRPSAVNEVYKNVTYKKVSQNHAKVLILADFFGA